MFNYSVILSNVGSCCDRFLSSGYDRAYTTKELFERMSQIEGIDGVELIGGANISKDNIPEIQELLDKYNFKLTSIIPDHFGKVKWGKGAFTNPDKRIRQEAIEETCIMMDAAKELGCELINIWNGQDGYDYPLQVDYFKAYEWMVDGIKACADYNQDIKIALEYKPKEPRTHSFISNVFSTLMYVKDICCDNVGVTIDTGHALEAYESMSEAACAAMKTGKLFHMHFNDNYRYWDDDMIVGSVHTIEYIELLYWLKKGGYKGYLSMDQYPYREDSVRAVNQSVKWLKSFEKSVDRIDEKLLKQALDSQDAVTSSELMRQLLFD